MAKSTLTTLVILTSLIGSAAGAEQRWEYKEQSDAISGREVRWVTLAGEDFRSTLIVKAHAGERPFIALVPKVVIKPDEVHDNSMGVRVTIRSTNMESPVSRMWNMRWMNYDSTSMTVRHPTCVKMFEGDSVTVQLDTLGKRFTFPTTGEDCEGLEEAVAKVLAIAAPDPAPATAQADKPAPPNAPARKPYNPASDAGRRAGTSAVKAAGVHAGRLGDAEILRRAKAAAKAGKLDGEDADAFIVGYASAFKTAH